LDKEKSGSANDDAKNRERIKIYAVIAGVLILVALLSSALTNVAVRPGTCGGISQQQAYNCTQRLAYSTSNGSICHTLPSSYADPCYYSIAANTENVSMCAQISDPNESGECVMYIANQTKNPSLCGRLRGSMLQSCTERAAISLSSPGACISLSNGTARQICLSSVYLNEAVNEGRDGSCAMIESNNNSQITYSSVSLVGLSQNSNYVNLTQVTNYAALSNVTLGARDLCYIYIAYSSMSQSYCSNVSSNMSTICNSSASRFNTVSHNSSLSQDNFSQFMQLCEQQASSSQCNSTSQYLEAVTAKNITQCKSLSGAYSSQCYYTLAQEYNNTNYCSYITNATINSECIQEIRNGYNATLGS
jgi:hypothetical protein